ncbi:MAG TPA: hypothetical protein DCW31_03450 [Lactobacillus sp.]|nr:hypothetical protein [Lactobacillus sp.]
MPDWLKGVAMLLGIMVADSSVTAVTTTIGSDSFILSLVVGTLSIALPIYLSAIIYRNIVGNNTTSIKKALISQSTRILLVSFALFLALSAFTHSDQIIAGFVHGWTRF